MRSSLIAAIVVLMVVACGSSPSAAQGPTVASVAVQPGDLPNSMHRCDLSGDINTFLTKIKTSSPSTYTTTKATWDLAQKNGATAGEVVFFADSTTNCKDVAANTSGISSATYKLVVDYVFQFKDEASATKYYSTESSQAQLKTAGTPVTEGTKTGLGPNSVTVSFGFSSQTFYIAVWQHKAFTVILAILNLDAATSQKVAVAENKRIT